MEAAILFREFLLHERFEKRTRGGKTKREEAKEIAPAPGRLHNQFDDRAKQGLKNLLDRNRVVASVLLELIEQSETRFVERFHPSIQHGEDEGILGREMIIDRRQVHSGCARNRTQ